MRAQCCICSDLFENSASINIAASPCGHTFHEECLMRWMDKSSTCPSCRTHVKKSQIIKHLFFDIWEDADEKEDVDKLVNQLGSLKAQLGQKDKENQELAESRDYFSAQFVAVEASREEIHAKLQEEQNVREVLQRDLRVLRKENAAFMEEMKEFRKTQQKLQELENVEKILKGCEIDIQKVVNQYSECGEASVKHLASLLTVVKRVYYQELADIKTVLEEVTKFTNYFGHCRSASNDALSQALADKKVLWEQVTKLKNSIGHYHSAMLKSKKEAKDLRVDLEKSNDALSQVEKDNNENRRKLVHLRNALRYNKTEGSQSFHKALHEDSPNVAYTPPRELDLGTEESSQYHTAAASDLCTSPDLFESTPLARKPLKRKYLEESDEPKLKMLTIPTAAERLQASKLTKSSTVEDETPNIPQSMLSILQKKLTGQSNSRTHVPSIITRGYDGFGGSANFVHSPDRPGIITQKMKSKTKKTGTKPKTFGINQPQISSFVRNVPSSSSSSSSSFSGEPKAPSNSQSERYALKTKNSNSLLPKQSSIRTFQTSSSSSLFKSVPKLSSDLSKFIDLT